MREPRLRRQMTWIAEGGARFGLSSLALVQDGRPRPCLLYAPEDRKPAERFALLLALHGGAGNPVAMARVTRFHEIAARERFIVAYPGGAGPSPRHATWNAGGDHVDGWAEENRIDDVGYARQLVRRIGETLPVDTARVYAAGMSKGAMMAYRLALSASDMIAAIAAVSGPMCEEPAETPHPVAVVHIHGARDRNVPFEGGRGPFTRPGASWPSSEKSLAFWRKVNQAAEERYEPANAETLRRRSVGVEGHDVELILLEKRGHEWPAPRPMLIRRLLGRAPKDGLDASEEIWRFLKDKRLSA